MNTLRTVLFSVILGAAGNAFGWDLVSVDSSEKQGSEFTEFPVLSSDGRYVLFTTRNRFVAEDTDNTGDVYLRDRQLGTTTLVSAGVGGTAANEPAAGYAIALVNGEVLVLFSTGASNMQAVQSYSGSQLYLRNMTTNALTVVSRSTGGDFGDGPHFDARISDDGKFIVYVSGSTNLVANDTNARDDIFLFDIDNTETTRVSLPEVTGEIDDHAQNPFLSGDGNFVAFSTSATNLVTGDTNGDFDVYRIDLRDGSVLRISNGFNGEPNADSHCTGISDDGMFVSYRSIATNLVVGDTNGLSDSFVYDVAMDQTIRVSVDSAGNQMTGSGSGITTGALSGNGEYYVFSTLSATLVADDTNGKSDVFRHHLPTSVTEKLSINPFGDPMNDSSNRVDISADGAVVVYESRATNLCPPDANGGDVDIFSWPGTPKIDPAIAQRAKLLKKLRVLKKKLRNARRAKQVARVKRFSKKIRKIKSQLRALS